MFQQAAAFLKHKQVHVADQILPFKDLDKPGWHDHAPVRVEVTHQGLRPCTGAGLKVEFRLKNYLKLSPVNAVQQLLDQLQPPIS